MNQRTSIYVNALQSTGLNIQTLGFGSILTNFVQQRYERLESVWDGVGNMGKDYFFRVDRESGRGHTVHVYLLV